MSDVKWIKITTDIFDDEKILLIESMPDAYEIITIWFKLLCLAGKQNNNGVFLLNDRIPYTDKMLATIFRMKDSTVQLALQTFEQFGMVELVDGVITIPNWGKHQSLERLESRKDYMRGYMKEYREKQQAQIAVNSPVNNVNSLRKHDVNAPEEEKEIEEEKEEEKDKRDGIGPSGIVALFHTYCPSYPKVKVISQARSKAIRARLKVYSKGQFVEMFKKAEASSFLKGANDRNWSANFDWLMKDSNFAKVLDGNYDDRGMPQSRMASELDNAYAMMREWAESEG